MPDRIWDTDPDLSGRADAERGKFHTQQDLGWGRAPSEQPWPQFDPAALYGLAGEVVTTLSPHTESDPIAILLQLLAMIGNSIGRSPYYQVEGDRHYLNLFALLVGETARARKGTSLGRVRQIMRPADSDWERTRIVSGLSSGEGVIWAVRDPVISRVKDKKTGIEKKRLSMPASTTNVFWSSRVNSPGCLLSSSAMATRFRLSCAMPGIAGPSES